METAVRAIGLAEARADALRLNKSSVDLRELLHAMADLYEPSLAERGMSILVDDDGPALIDADPWTGAEAPLAQPGPAVEGKLE